jgi:hypothetical protein
MITIRRAGADDARKIGAVFDAAVRDGWKYLGELVSRPMFPPEEWDKLVTEHAPPNALLVAVNEMDQVVGYTAVHPQEGEMHLLFVTRSTPAAVWAGHCSQPRTRHCVARLS